nr:hypothetical protein [uncultured bacterium]
MTVHRWLLVSLACLAVWQITGAVESAGLEDVSLDQRHASAQLALAETSLQRVRQVNARVANVISANVVAEYVGDVETAKLRVANVENAGGGEPFAVWLRGAEASARAAEAAWKSAVRANEQKSDTVDPLEVQRLRLLMELAQLNVERGRAIADKPRETQLQWQLGLLHDDVERLKEYVLRNPPASRAHLLWRF